MSKIIATEFYSVDGFISDPKDEMDWVLADFDPELGKYEDELYESAESLMLGRVTYKIWEAFWPNVTSGEDAEMARKINGLQKVVFSTTLENVVWENSKLLKTIDADEISKIRQAATKNILVVGSSTIVQQLTDAGLIDEYHLVVHPVILGKGKPLFKATDATTKLKLSESIVYKNGVVLLKYARL
ncbi:MAG: dihydrofolate reductase family protein [Pyrinomonadaceae bacterium]